MFSRRKYINHLNSLMKNPKPKPLLLWGARQVGKTHLAKDFAREFFQDHIYLNFEQNPGLNLIFQDSLDPDSILKKIAIFLGRGPIRQDTLIILDEIQESERALNSLKYFNESPVPYKVIAAGSLLGVKLSRSGFPVGQVHFVDVYPIDFGEYLEWIGQSLLKEHLEEQIKAKKKVPIYFHEKLLSLYREYVFVGGMPEVINEFQSDPHDFVRVRDAQLRILRAYELDFAKHAPKDMVVRISEIFDKIPNHLAKENKKFMYSAIAKSARARDYSSALQWLIDARILHKVSHISNAEIPLLTSSDSEVFKTYFVDTGLLGAMMQIPHSILLHPTNLFSSYKGAMAENAVAQLLIARGKSCFYWTSEGKAEVDFVFQNEAEIVAIEVKSGKVLRSKSLKEFAKKYPDVLLYRCSQQEYQIEERIINIPNYQICFQSF